EDGIRDRNVTGVQTCALPISKVTLSRSLSLSLDLSIACTCAHILLAIVETVTWQCHIYCQVQAKTHRASMAGRSACMVMSSVWRSEERRVGKGCSARGGRRTA